MNDYETRRAAKIAQNQALLANLDIKPLAGTTRSRQKDDKPPASKKRKVQTVPTAPARTSARIANTDRPKPDYSDEPSIKAVSLPRSKPKTGGKKGALGSLIKEETEPLVPTKNVEDIQAGWTAWEPVAPPPTRDDGGVFHFEDDWADFTPNKSPEEMLREGVFGGSYWRPLKSRKLGIVVRDDWKELPEAWVEGLRVERSLVSEEYDPEVNKYGVSCGQSIEEWEAAGWIAHEWDVRGWFQWYCRFFLGRRCEDDGRQISRWKKCAGPTGRWKRVLMKQYGRAGIRSVEQDDEEVEGAEERRGVSPVVSQTCFHWAFEVRQRDLDEYWGGGG